MASARVLRSVALLGAVSAILSGCAAGPIWARRVEGWVIDEATGQGVGGAEVFYSWSLWGLVPMSGRNDFGHRWVTTEADGHFVIRGHIEGRPWAFPAYTERRPHLEVLHPQYGDFAFGYETDPPVSWRKLELRIRRNEKQLVWLSDPRHSLYVCGERSRLGCRRACEVWWGSVEPCINPGGLGELRRK